MANTSDSISHRHDHHDWDSDEYVSNWAKGQDPKEKDRHAAFTLLADTIPFSKDRPIRILDLGAERMRNLTGRFEYVLCDFARAGWNEKLKGSFEAVVSSIAIHNVREPKIIEA